MAFILASVSPRRLDLLNQIARPPDIVEAADIDETPNVGESPHALAERLAVMKADDVAIRHPSDVVLGADTVVACGRRILPNPTGAAAARACLQLLSGRRHRVYGGVAVVSPHRRWSRSIMTQVVFKRLSDDDISDYIASGEWQGKAGGYGIQGRAGAFVKRINGSYSNVVGLCLNAVESVLFEHLGPVSRDNN